MPRTPAATGFDFGTKHFSTVSHSMVTLLPLILYET